jgi:hypothetical protein
MRFTIKVSGESGRDAADLYNWLLRDRDQLFGVRLGATTDTAEPSEMGFDVATINALVANTLALGSLITAIATWRDTRRAAAAPDPVITITWADSSVTLTGDDPEQLRAIAQAMSETVATVSPSTAGRGTSAS